MSSPLAPARPAGGPGELDVVSALACPLPVRIICELLGVPAADREVFAGWSATIAEGLQPQLGGRDAARADASAQAWREFDRYFGELIAARREHPGEDLLGAVEETLRYDAPVQLSGRVARGAMQIGDVPVPDGAVVLLLLLAATGGLRRSLTRRGCRGSATTPTGITWLGKIASCSPSTLRHGPTAQSSPPCTDCTASSSTSAPATSPGTPTRSMPARPSLSVL